MKATPALSLSSMATTAVSLPPPSFVQPSAVVEMVTVKVSSSSSMSSSVRGMEIPRVLTPLGTVTGESMGITSDASAVDEPVNPRATVNETPTAGASSLRVMVREALAPSATRVLSVMEKVLVCAAAGAVAKAANRPSSKVWTGRKRERRMRRSPWCISGRAEPA